MTLIQFIRKVQQIGPGEVCVTDKDVDFIGYVERVTEDGGDVLFHIKSGNELPPDSGIPGLQGPDLLRDLHNLLAHECNSESQLVFKQADGKWATLAEAYEEESDEDKPALMLEIEWGSPN